MTHPIRVGIGGWSFEPWDETFYPAGLPKSRQMEYMSRKMTAVEVNATYYSSFKPETFAKWREASPDGFMFSLKAHRFSTVRKTRDDMKKSIDLFLGQGITALKDKLGPINWQFAPTKKFDPKDVEGFLKLLPKKIDGRAIRHALEVRHDSFRTPDFVALAREHGAAIVVAGDSDYPQIADVTAPFVYARIMGTSEDEKLGYSRKALDAWIERARLWAAGKSPKDLDTVTPQKTAKAGPDVFLYVISGFKERNPAAAMAMIEKLK